MDNAVIKRHISFAKTKDGRKRKQHLCLDKAYNSKPEEQAIAKRGYVPTFTIQEKKRRGSGKKQKDLKSQKTSCKKMGCRKNKFMAQ